MDSSNTNLSKVKDTVIITGSSRGIGYAIAKKLQDNFRVIGLSRTNGNGIDTIKTDVSDIKQVENAFNRIVKEYGLPKFLINSEGVLTSKDISSVNDWDESVSTILLGVFYCTQQFVNHAKGGIIINIVPMASMMYSYEMSVYVTSRIELINLFLIMAEELKQYDIRVYSLSLNTCIEGDEVALFINNLLLRDIFLDGDNPILGENLL